MTTRTRIASIDIVRGAVMVLMAIDHVRVYSGVPAGGPTAGVFFTRWVTHFCAPAFVFLAGTSAFLYGQALRSADASSARAASRHDTAALARYLVTRGLLLVLLELTVIRASWTFGVDYSQFLLAGVIWMLGWCMILLAGLVWLPTRAIGIIGLVVIVFQGMFAPLGRALPAALHQLWEFIYPIGAEVSIGADGAVGRRALQPRAVGGRDGRGLCLWRDHGARACGTATTLPEDRLVRDGALRGGRRTRRAARARATRCAAGALPLSQPAEISGLAALPADDAGTDDRPAAGGRTHARVAGRACWRRSAACRCSTTCSTFRSSTRRRFSCGSSVTAAPTTPLRDGAVRVDSRRRAMESAAPLSRLRRGRGVPLFSLPVVRPRQGAHVISRAALSLDVRSRCSRAFHR